MLRAMLALICLLVVSGCAQAARPSTSTSVGVATSPTPGEAVLLAGMRLDLQGRCTPIPARAGGPVASVRCLPDHDDVDEVIVDLFPTDEARDAAYADLMRSLGIALRSHGGRCEPIGPSEGAYVPEAPGSVAVSERSACFLDADGAVHYIAKLSPFVLTEAIGRDSDIPAVEQWAWAGNQDQPGAPTIWRSTGPASPEK
jgi:hypothetical protein